MVAHVGKRTAVAAGLAPGNFSRPLAAFRWPTMAAKSGASGRSIMGARRARHSVTARPPSRSLSGPRSGTAIAGSRRGLVPLESVEYFRGWNLRQGAAHQGRLVLALTLVVGVLGFWAEPAAAAPEYLPVNTYRFETDGTPCTVRVMHGNIYGTAFSKIQRRDSECGSIRAEVTGYSNQLGYAGDDTGYQTPALFVFIQAQVPYYNLIGSRMTFWYGDSIFNTDGYTPFP